MQFELSNPHLEDVYALISKKICFEGALREEHGCEEQVGKRASVPLLPMFHLHGQVSNYLYRNSCSNMIVSDFTV